MSNASRRDLRKRMKQLRAVELREQQKFEADRLLKMEIKKRQILMSDSGKRGFWDGHGCEPYPIQEWK